MCYLIAKKFSETGCLALQMTHGQHLADFKERLVQAVGYEDIQLVTISRPSAYGEYEPYHFVDTEQEFDAYAYDKQWKSLKQKYKDAKGLTEEEYLSHMQKEDKFLPVVTVVIYQGEKAWDGARDLHGVLNIPDEIKPFVGNYPMHLVEVVNNKLQFKNTDNRDLFQLLNLVYNASLDKRERMKKVVEYEDSHTIDEDVVRALAATNSRYKRLYYV